MSTSPGADQSAGQTAIFRIHISDQRVVEEALDLQKPIYLLVSGLTHQYQLPAIEGGYGMFGGTERRPISRELSLLRTPYASGGDLYLASNRAPWWVGMPAAMAARPAGERRPITKSQPVRSAPSLNPKTVALAVIGVIAVGLLALLFWPRGHDSAQAVEPTDAFLPPTSVSIAPTATLLPVTPTPDPAVSYQEGLAAYNAGEWPKAVESLQHVYANDAHYQDVSQVLGAALYNWGIAMRDQGDIAGAIEHFAAAITVAPDHPLAAGEQQKAQLYLDARGARDSGALRDAAIKLEELRALQGDYLDSTAQLYDIYLAYGAELEAQKQPTDALRIYEKAVELPLEDVSAARAKVRELVPPSPTPAAKRLRFSVANYNDTPSCVSIRISGIGTSGWYFSVDGVGGVVGYFDSAGNARACGLGNGQEVTITVHSADGRGVSGGMGVPSKGSAIMVASWR